MKYRDILIRSRFKKGTGRGRRRVVSKVIDDLARRVAPAMHQAVTDALIHGQSYVKVCWDDDTITVGVVEPEGKEYPAP